MNDWRDMKLRGDIVRPFVKSVGNNANAGLLAGAVSFPIMYYLFRHAARKRDVPDAERRAAMVSGIGSAALGLGTWWGLRKSNRTPYYGPDDFADTVMGPDTAVKESAEPWAFDKGTLIQGVEEMPITDSQRSFLNEGISLAPGKYETTLWGLGDGFSKAVDHSTGGLLGYATRAMEGGLLGGAFGSMLGLSPRHVGWAKGIGAVADALQGSQLFNAIGQLLG